MATTYIKLHLPIAINVISLYNSKLNKTILIYDRGPVE